LNKNLRTGVSKEERRSRNRRKRRNIEEGDGEVRREEM
jgi:hypothetical protein